MFTLRTTDSAVCDRPTWSFNLKLFEFELLEILKPAETDRQLSWL